MLASSLNRGGPMKPHGAPTAPRGFLWHSLRSKKSVFLPWVGGRIWPDCTISWGSKAAYERVHIRFAYKVAYFMAWGDIVCWAYPWGPWGGL